MNRPLGALSLLLVLTMTPACGDDGTGDDDSSMDTGDASTSAADDSTGSAMMGDPAAGMTVFTNSCSNDACHGADGMTGSGPNLATEVPALSDMALESVIQNGVPSSGGSPGMPGLNLAAGDLADVTAYLRQQFG